MKNKILHKTIPLESLLDNMMEGFQLIGFDWRYLYVNQAVVKQSKYPSKNDLLGYTMMEKYPGIEKTPMFKVLQKCMKDRAFRNLENEFTFPDGTKGWFELRIQPVPDGLFILSADITERKKAELQQTEHVNGLEEMLFMTSHKIRQPVTHILGISDLLEKAGHTEKELKKIAGYMKQSAVSLDEFTKELTMFLHNMKIKANIAALPVKDKPANKQHLSC